MLLFPNLRVDKKEGDVLLCDQILFFAVKASFKKCKRQLVCRSWLAKELCGRENEKGQPALPGEHVSDTEQLHHRFQSDPVGSSSYVS